MPFKAPSVTLFMSGSSTYSLLIRETTSVNTPMCLYVSSGDVLWPSMLPIRSRTVRQVDAATTINLKRLFITEKCSGRSLCSLYSAPRTGPSTNLGRPGRNFGDRLFPVHSVPEPGDVGRVVAAVPAVSCQVRVQAHDTALRVPKPAGK